MNVRISNNYYLYNLSNESYTRFSFRAQNYADLKKWQTAFRAELKSAMGLSVIAKRAVSNLNPQMSGEERFDSYTRQQWQITTEEGFDLPFYLLLPQNLEHPRPLVLAPHGHSKTGKDAYAGICRDNTEREEIIEGQRDIAFQAVQAGYVAIAPDMRGFAGLKRKIDIDQDNNNSCQAMQMNAWLFGRTIIGERVWDIMRLVDFALTLPFVNRDKIAITGNSGGGTISLYAAACDERIKISVPASYYCTFKGSIGEIKHCCCNYIPGIMNLGEMYDIAGLIAPRPLLIITGKDDPIFPLSSVEVAFKKVNEIYKVAGAEDLCRLYIGNGGHRYYKQPAWEFIKEVFQE